LDANDLSPKEATEMSREIKYIGIGMDVHKEAMVIAVRSGSVALQALEPKSSPRRRSGLDASTESRPHGEEWRSVFA
jgi:hypothetical protein